jgi:serine protease Do
MKLSFFALFFSLILIVGCIAEPDPVDTLRETGEAFTQVVKTATPAVVSIRVEQTVEQALPQQDILEYFFGPQFRQQQQPRSRQRRQMGQGSGFIISKDGYILTNNHVINDADSIVVTLTDGREFKAKLVGTDPQTEIALIKVEGEENLPTVKLGDSDELQVGEWAIAVGNPFGLQETVTAGIISATGRSDIGIIGRDGYEDFIQTDAAINPGNSGGPLLNIDGEVIGINTAIFSQSGGYMGIGFAIPINMAINIKDALIEDGRVQRSLIGVYLQELTPELADSFGLEEANGILITQVGEDSAAREAGVESGDIVLELNGDPVNKLSTFRSNVAAFRPGTEITLSLLRNGKRIEKTLTTRARDGEMTADRFSALEKAGFDVEELSEETILKMRLPANTTGMIVTTVDRDGPAWASGLREGMIIRSVNRMSTADSEEFNQALQAAQGSKTLLLLVQIPRYGARYMVIPLND